MLNYFRFIFPLLRCIITFLFYQPPPSSPFFQPHFYHMHYLTVYTIITYFWFFFLILFFFFLLAKAAEWTDPSSWRLAEVAPVPSCNKWHVAHGALSSERSRLGISRRLLLPAAGITAIFNTAAAGVMAFVFPDTPVVTTRRAAAALVTTGMHHQTTLPPYWCRPLSANPGFAVHRALVVAPPGGSSEAAIKIHRRNFHNFKFSRFKISWADVFVFSPQRGLLNRFHWGSDTGLV